MWYHNVGFKETSRNKKAYLGGLYVNLDQSGRQYDSVLVFSNKWLYYSSCVVNGIANTASTQVSIHINELIRRKLQ